MKNLRYLLLLGVFTLSASQSIAATVTGLNVFSSDTPALASEVNDNFTTIQEAIDDNFNKINQRAVSVLAPAFVQTDGDCTVKMNAQNYYYTAGTSCWAAASVQLPDKAIMNSLSCTILDDTSNQYVEFQLLRVPNISANKTVIFSTPGSVDSASYQILNDDTAIAGTDIVDNTNYAYAIFASSIGMTSAGALLKISSCRVLISY